MSREDDEQIALGAAVAAAHHRSNRETGWLCEWLHATGPKWWTLGGEDGGYFAKDSLKALRFARKEDAQAYIDDAGWTEIVPTEHEWSDPKAKP